MVRCANINTSVVKEIITIQRIKDKRKVIKTIIYNYYVIPNLKSAKTLESTCSFKFGLLRAM